MSFQTCCAPWGSYEISRDGVIRPIDANTNVKIWRNKNGYVCCNLWNDNINRIQPGLYVHRLMGMTFMPDSMQPFLEIDHINGIRNDNRLENLRCITHSENLKNRKPYKWSLAAKRRLYMRNFNGPQFVKKLMLIKI